MPHCFPATVGPCPACAGRGCQPTGDGHLEPCGPCRGSGIPCVVGDLGGTHSYPKGRPFEYDPTTKEALVSRGKKVAKYHLAPFAAAWDRPGQAVRVTKLDAKRPAKSVKELVADRDREVNPNAYLVRELNAGYGRPPARLAEAVANGPDFGRR